MLEQLPLRFQVKIAVDPTTGCWHWTAAKDYHGYGRVNWGGHGKAVYAHRKIYELLRGDLPPILDHLCRVRDCVNPDHLEPVTQRENVARGVGGAVARQRYADHLWCPRGHPLFGPNLYAHTTKYGYVNKQCRTCRAANNRARRQARSAAKRAAASED